jgi:hypothetical protein
MREQEPIIVGYIDLLVQRLHEHCGKGADKKPMDMTAWYNWTTFDIIGDLAFGEPFGCLEQARYHPWVAAIVGMVRAMSYVLALKYLGLESLIGVLSRLTLKKRQEHMDKTRDKLIRRMELGYERPDLIEGLLRNKDCLVSDLDLLQPLKVLSVQTLITLSRTSISTNCKSMLA